MVGAIAMADDREGLVDGCICDAAFDPTLVTADAELPVAAGGVAAGGVAAVQAATTQEDGIDGCDVDFAAADTADEDLPPATGGVA